jgi:ribosomal RNA-processing protein 12
MTTDTKRHLRILLGFLLKKLCNKFGADEIVRLVPGNDEQTHKRLRKIRKEMSRAKRNRDGKKKNKGGSGEGDSDDDDDNDVDDGLEKKSVT